MVYTKSCMLMSQLALIYCAWTSRYAFNGSRPNTGLWLLTLFHRSPDPRVYPLSFHLWRQLTYFTGHSLSSKHTSSTSNLPYLAPMSTQVVSASYCWNRCVLLIWMTDNHPHSILFLFAATVNNLLWTIVAFGSYIGLVAEPDLESNTTWPGSAYS